MRDRFPTIYGQTPLDAYTLRQRIVIRIADLAFYLLIRIIGRTLRYEVEGNELYERSSRDGKVPILCFWHDRIFAGTYHFRDRGIVVLTSASFDGEYIARFIRRLGYGAVRGSSTRGGVRGLVEMIRLMRSRVPMAFTVDGPRGPRYEAKSGAVLLAKKTENPILPFGVECSSYWTINSWDKLQIPRPFARARVIFAEPIYVDPNADDAAIEAGRADLQRALDQTVERGREWRTG